MDPRQKKLLEERLYQEVRFMLTEGDRPYWLGLSRPDFFAAVKNELQFLGFYAHKDHETPAVIHGILEQHLDQWRADLLGPSLVIAGR